VTFEQLQDAVGQFSNEERFELWRTCPWSHPPDTLLALDTGVTSQVLRYCPRCLVAFTMDGLALNAPGRRVERER
jgi:hypothetical protein